MGLLQHTHYLEGDFTPKSVADHLNKYLMHEGLEVVKSNLCFKVREINSPGIKPRFVDAFLIQTDAHSFIIEQCDKCREKIGRKDYDGAITNARSMLESLFEEVLRRAGKDVPDHGGDLLKLYKEVKKHLNLDAAQKDLSETLQQTLRGITSVVSGIAGISNKMGDRHARSYKPERHHAQLAVNMAYSLSDFLLASLDYQNQLRKGKEALNA